MAPTEDADSSAVAEPGKDAAAEEVPAAEDSSLPTQLNAEQEDTGTPAHEVPEAQAEEVIKPATPESLANTDPVYDVLEPTGITDEPVVELIPRGLFSYTDIDNILMRRINEARIAEGAKALFAAPHLYTSAVEWSEEMYAQGYVSNSPTLEDDVMFSGACVTTNKIGETVSFADFYDYDQTVAWTADEIAQSMFDGYMASERETLLSSEYTHYFSGSAFFAWHFSEGGGSRVMAPSTDDYDNYFPVRALAYNTVRLVGGQCYSAVEPPTPGKDDEENPAPESPNPENPETPVTPEQPEDQQSPWFGRPRPHHK